MNLPKYTKLYSPLRGARVPRSGRSNVVFAFETTNLGLKTQFGTLEKATVLLMYYL